MAFSLRTQPYSVSSLSLYLSLSAASCQKGHPLPFRKSSCTLAADVAAAFHRSQRHFFDKKKTTRTKVKKSASRKHCHTASLSGCLDLYAGVSEDESVGSANESAAWVGLVRGQKKRSFCQSSVCVRVSSPPEWADDSSSSAPLCGVLGNDSFWDVA